jgi:hypothetical protein
MTISVTQDVLEAIKRILYHTGGSPRGSCLRGDVRNGPLEPSRRLVSPAERC